MSAGTDRNRDVGCDAGLWIALLEEQQQIVGNQCIRQVVEQHVGCRHAVNQRPAMLGAFWPFAVPVGIAFVVKLDRRDELVERFGMDDRQPPVLAGVCFLGRAQSFG